MNTNKMKLLISSSKRITHFISVLQTGLAKPIHHTVRNTYRLLNEQFSQNLGPGCDDSKIGAARCERAEKKNTLSMKRSLSGRLGEGENL